jgi:hypothetical protein
LKSMTLMLALAFTAAGPTIDLRGNVGQPQAQAGLFKKIKKAAEKVGSGVKTAAKKLGSAAKKTAKATGSAVTKAAAKTKKVVKKAAGTAKKAAKNMATWAGGAKSRARSMARPPHKGGMCVAVLFFIAFRP